MYIFNNKDANDQRDYCYQTLKNNKSIVVNKSNNTFWIFFTSHALYTEDNYDGFKKNVLDNDYYDWEHIYTSEKIQKLIGEACFVRDVYNHWYLKGINGAINSLEKLADYLKKKAGSRKIVTVGSSGGAFAAIAIGCILCAESIYAFSPQISLPSYKKYYRGQFPSDSDSDKTLKWADLTPLIRNNNSSDIFCFFSSFSEKDYSQLKVAEQINSTRLYSFATDSTEHGKSISGIDMINVLSMPKDTLKNLCLQNKGQTLTHEIFDFVNCNSWKNTKSECKSNMHSYPIRKALLRVNKTLFPQKTVSVITVCYNEEKNIAFTLDSILSQSCNDYEVIVCDGGSTDETYDIVLSYKELFEKKGIHFYSHSIKDGGTYYGMNMGIDAASGKYCIFMNGGDRFNNNDVIQQASFKLLLNSVDVLYGDSHIFGNCQSYFNYNNIECLRYGECINHQSMFIKTSRLKNRKYDTSYSICADTEYWFYLLKLHARFKHWDYFVADFRLDGMSSTKPAFTQEMSAIRNKYQTLRCFTAKRFYPNKKKYLYNKGCKNSNLIEGWAHTKKDVIWSTGNKSSFYYSVLFASSYVLTLNIAIENNYNNKLFVNDRYLCDIEKRSGIHQIYIPEEYMLSGKNVFTIQTDDKVYRFCEKYPDSNDTRYLNLLLYSTEIKHIKKVADQSILCYGSLSGWSVNEGNYRWAIGDCTTFCYFLTDLCHIQIEMEIKMDLGYKNDLYVNDSFLSKIDEHIGNHVFFVNKYMLHKGLNIFSIRPNIHVVPACDKNPESPDTRELNLCVKELKITEIPIDSTKTYLYFNQ